jgi:hypothetical protein
MPVSVGFVMGKVAMGVFLQVRRVYPVSNITPSLHIHLFIFRRFCIILAVDNVVK